MYLLAWTVLSAYGFETGLNRWAIATSTSAVIVLLVAWWLHPQIEDLTPRQLRLTLVWVVAVPMGFHWGALGLAIEPRTLAEELPIVLLIFISALAPLALLGSGYLPAFVASAALVSLPNYLWFADMNGFGSVSSLTLFYGLVIASVGAVLSRRALFDREALVLRTQRLVDRVQTEQTNLAALNAELRYRATHDLLMGIPNRDLLQTELEAAIAQSARSDQADQSVGLLFLDLDHFKFVNDTMGHATGDALLEAVGDRIRNCLSNDDALVARVGGDELVVLVRNASSEAALVNVAQRLAQLFDNPFVIDSVELQVGVSIGVAASREHERAEQLYRHADAALYEAKEAGRGKIVLADDTLRARRDARIRTELALRRALLDGDIAAWFQPEVDLVSGRIVACEALARWTTRDGIAVAGDFIGVARRSGLLEQLTLQIFDDICSWRARYGYDLPIAFNCSVADLPALLMRQARRRDSRMDGLRIEIAETDIIHDFERAAHVLGQARDLGAHIMVDDFGTGFSSLRMLTDLPIDGIKIDRSYVARLETDRRVQSLVAGLADHGRNLDLNVVAEGIEIPTHAEALLGLGIDRAQGFLFSKAVHPAEFAELCALGYAHAGFAADF